MTPHFSDNRAHFKIYPRSTMAPSVGEDVTAAVEVRSFGELQAQLRALSYSEVKRPTAFYLFRSTLANSAHFGCLVARGRGERATSAASAGDLVAASTAREKAEHALEKAQRDALEFSQILLPLRKENAHLTRENNSVRRR